MCGLYSGCLHFNETACTDCKTGQKECPEFSCDMVGRCLGVVRTIKVAHDQVHCKDMCRNDTMCHFYTFDTNSMNCFLTNDCPALDSTCTTCLANEKGCGSGDVAPSCPENFEFIGERCYHRSMRERSQDVAAYHCKTLHAKLPLPKNEPEAQALYTEVTSQTWLDLSDRDGDGMLK